MPWYSTKRATTVTEIDGMQACIYHQTAVVRWDDDKIVLNTGGYYTATTKSRMNQVSHEYDLDFSVYQEKGEWFVRPPGCTWEDVVPFEDGMILDRRAGRGPHEYMTCDEVKDYCESLASNMDVR